MFALFKPLLRQSFATTGVYLLIIALTLAISATTALKFSNEQVQNAVALQAAKMQAADLVLSDNLPIDAKWQKQAESLQLQQTKVTLFGSMASTNDQFVMVNVKAIAPQFPLRGELRIAPEQTHIRQGEVWLSQRAQDLLHVNVGSQIKIADGDFKVGGIITHDSNQEMGFSAFSPTVIIHQDDVAKTNAIQVGSRIDYRLLLAGSAENTQRFVDVFQAFVKAEKLKLSQAPQQVQDAAQVASSDGAEVNPNDAMTLNSLRLRTASDANSRLIEPIENLDTFLQLANILTILLCGIAIALTSQRYVQQNQDHIALMRCMGAGRGQIFRTYLLLLSLIVLIAMVLGSAIGLGMGYALLQLMLQLIPNLELQFSVLQMLVGPLPIAILTSAVVLFGFILPGLLQLLNTPPIRVIRQQEKSAGSIVLTLSAGLLSLVIFSILLTENLKLSLIVVSSIFVLCGVLYGVVWVLLKWLKALKNRYSAYVRTPSQTALQITALALGLSLISVLAVLRTDLLERWQQQLPEGTPNQFVYGLPPFEVEQFRQQLQEKGWKSTPLYPNVRGRLIAKNDQAFSTQQVAQINALRRELNLTQSNQYPQDNQIIQGNSALQKSGEVSVENKLAEELGIKVGDTLTFSLPEGELHAKVVNLRTVEWRSFSPNFFFIFAPNSLDENSGSYLGSFYTPQAEKSQLIGMVQQFSNTVFIDVSAILDEVKRLVNVLMQIISVLALLVSISGFLVLVACINLLMDERKREVALMRSFGSSKAQLKRMMTIEIGLIGFIAGIVSCFFAEVISAIACWRMNMEMQLHLEIWLILPLVMTVLCAVIGRYRLSYLSDIPPLQSLRELNS